MRSQSGTERPRLWVMLAMAASLCVAVPAFAQSQCAITGPNYLCSGQATLCGPNGPFEYHWTGPNGFVGPDARCITVTVAGTYSLRTFDFLNGLWAGPCTHDIVGEAEAAPCLIEGSPTGCTGEPAELCGPAGAFTYRWTGPNGFADTSRCVSVTVSGTYSLQVQSASGCPATTCSHTITFGPCGPPQKANCPRTATFWNSQCDGGSKRRFSADERGALASRVDDMSQYLQWSDDLRSWCRTLEWHWGMSLEDRARRQFTAVATNMAAGDMQLKLNGRSLGLTRETSLSDCDDARSIGEWLSKTDAKLVTLRGLSRNSSQARAAYRKIIRTAWSINHARHIGPTCIDAAHKLASDSEAEEIMVELDGVDALVDEPMLLEAPSPNPFRGVTRITFELTQDTGEPFEIAVYDIAGRKVQSLVSGVRNAGVYELQWDGHRADGSVAPGGLYFVHGHVGNFRVQNRVVLMP